MKERTVKTGWGRKGWELCNCREGGVWKRGVEGWEVWWNEYG